MTNTEIEQAISTLATAIIEIADRAMEDQSDQDGSYLGSIHLHPDLLKALDKLVLYGK